MSEIDNLEKARQQALEKYLSAKKKLEVPQALELFALAAQEANDFWLEYKKICSKFANVSVLKKIGECYDY
jgi:hypothetical protein